MILPSQDSTRLTITIGPQERAVYLSFRGPESSDNVFDWIFNRRARMRDLIE